MHAARHYDTEGVFWCVIWQNGEIGDVTPAKNGPVVPLGRCPPLRSLGHRNTVLVASLSRTTCVLQFPDRATQPRRMPSIQPSAAANQGAGFWEW